GGAARGRGGDGLSRGGGSSPRVRRTEPRAPGQPVRGGARGGLCAGRPGGAGRGGGRAGARGGAGDGAGTDRARRHPARHHDRGVVPVRTVGGRAGLRRGDAAVVQPSAGAPLPGGGGSPSPPLRRQRFASRTRYFSSTRSNAASRS